MPRHKSAVHDHFRPADDQGDRKIQLVQCVHCRHTCAGNNAARLLKHLQSGCWPASSQDDPRLERNAARPTQQGRQERSYESPTTTQPEVLVAQSGQSAVQTPARPPPTKSVTSARQAAAASANFFAQAPAVTTHYLLQVTVRDTKDPVVQRTLAIPNTFNFKHLERALATTFEYRTTTGMFDITTPAWHPGRGRPPRRKQIYIYSDEEQRNKWHRWDSEDAETSSDERLVDQVSFRALLEELQSLKIVYLVGTWAHDLEIVGSTMLSRASANRSDGHAVCLAGEGHAVLETSDAMMWQAFKDAYRTTTPTAQQKAYRVFYEQEIANGDPRGLGTGGPWRWDRENVNRELGLLPSAPSPPPPPAKPSSHSASPEPDCRNPAIPGHEPEVIHEPAPQGDLTPARPTHQQRSQPDQWQHQTAHNFATQAGQGATMQDGHYVPAEASALNQLRYG